MKEHFFKHLLPSPSTVYAHELGNFGRANSKGWAYGSCPFHRSRSGKSFSVNLLSGAYCCFGCGAKGGNVVAFTMRLHNLSFKAAAQRLGAWSFPPTESERLARNRRERQLQIEKATEGVIRVADRDRRLKARAILLSLIEIQRTTMERLSALGKGAPPESQDEVERCIEVASMLVDEIREADHNYVAAAGLECEL